MLEVQYIENMIGISTALKHITSMIDKYQSLDVMQYIELRKLMIDLLVEINTKGDVDE